MKSKILILILGILLPLTLNADEKVREETGVNKVWSELGFTGKNVIVAIFDRGIDYTHPDFTNDNGTTRILSIFDLTDNSGSNNAYNVGTIYNEEEINSALLSGEKLNTRDAVGHGTSTTGLAASNGRASNGLYTGMAPNCSIIIVKFTTEGAPAHDDAPAESPFYNPDLLSTAIQFVKDKSEELELPFVILANFGSSGGPMDGTSKFSRLIDAEFGNDSPGAIFVTGSSDDGNKPNHAVGQINQDDTLDLKIKNTGNQLRMDLWYDAQDQIEVIISNGIQSFGPFSAPLNELTRDQRTTDLFNYYHNGSEVDFFEADNNKREIMIDFKMPGNYIVKLFGKQISNGNFHASLNPSQIFAGKDNGFQNYVVEGYTIWDWASASNNICPNSYVIRENWIDIDGITRTDLGNEAGEGSLWPGSGIGPTYDGRIGITVSVPGNSNISAYADNSYFASFNHLLINDGNGKYGIQSAVSGAAPVLTGIIALMLEANPNLTSVEIKDILKNTSRTDEFTGKIPNVKWGYGKIDAYAAVSEVLRTTEVKIDQNIPQNIILHQNYPNPFNPTTIIRYSIQNVVTDFNQGTVELKVYDVLGKEAATLVNRKHTAGNYGIKFDASSLPSGVYFYQLQAGNVVQTKKMLLLK